MGNRLSKIYTRTGDKGTTGLSDGSRVAKDDARIEAIGDVDEVNSALGLVGSELADSDPLLETLREIQQQLFNLGGELATPDYVLIDEAQVSMLENTLDQLNAELPPLKDFILPGGNRAAAHCHLARSICRRAERRLVTLSHQATVRQPCLNYLNRLSDLLFVAARVLSRQDGGSEILWRHRSEKNA